MKNDFPFLVRTLLQARILCLASVALAVGASHMAVAQTQKIISTVAGIGIAGYAGDGGAANSAKLNYSQGIAIDAYGNFYIADTLNHRVRKVTPDGVISTVAGIGSAGYGGDGGPATSAKLNSPSGVVVDIYRNLYIADTSNHRIRKVTPDGIISTAVGTGVAGYGGDGGPATSAQLHSPYGVLADSFGNVFIADTFNQRIRNVSSDGIIRTWAGSGAEGDSGDGGSAAQAKLSYPRGMVMDTYGYLYIADSSNNRIRKVTPDRIISTLVGTGTAGYSGDGGAATSAQLDHPYAVAIDAARNLYIADTNNHRIRKVTLGGTISTVVGNGINGYSGDGGLATSAQLYFPSSVRVDAAGSLYIADTNNHRIRKATDILASLVWSNVSSGENMIWKGADSENSLEVTTFDSLAWKIVGVGDFNGSGQSDLFLRDTSTGENMIWKEADSTLSEPVAAIDDQNWKVSGVGDFDYDGQSDVLWRNARSGENKIWYSANSAEEKKLGSMSVSWTVAGVGDFNKDGPSDILWRNRTGQNVIWRSGDVEKKQEVTGKGIAWIVAGIGDFNGDRASDVLWRNNSTGENLIWKSANSANKQEVSTMTAPNRIVVGIGDFNDDGQDDIVWHDTVSGASAIWESANSETYQVLTTVEDVDWEIVGIGRF